MVTSPSYSLKGRSLERPSHDLQSFSFLHELDVRVFTTSSKIFPTSHQLAEAHVFLVNTFIVSKAPDGLWLRKISTDLLEKASDLLTR